MGYNKCDIEKNNAPYVKPFQRIFVYMGDDHYGDSADFYKWRGHRAYAVMKDGTQIELLRSRNCEPVNLDQVDHVLLADGTKLPAPNKQ